MVITMREVAERAGVSKSTVSQFLSKRYNYMSLDTKRKVEQAIEELNYIPNEVARSLKHKKTFIVGVISSTILSKFTTEVVRAIEDECQLEGVQVIVCNTDDDSLKEKNYVQPMICAASGWSYHFPTEENKKLYGSLVKNGYPFVFVDRKIDEISVDTVLLNNEKASELAVQTFAQHNHHNIGIITFPLGKKRSLHGSSDCPVIERRWRTMVCRLMKTISKVVGWMKCRISLANYSTWTIRQPQLSPLMT